MTMLYWPQKTAKYVKLDNSFVYNSDVHYFSIVIKIQFDEKFVLWLLIAFRLLQNLHMPWTHTCRVICKFYSDYGLSEFG